MNNFVLAKIRGENDYKKLMNDQILYDDVETAICNCEELDLSNTIDDTVLEEDKWHFINNFSSTEYSMSILTKIGDSVDYAQYSSTDSNDIVHIIACQENYLCLQGISKSKVIKRKFITINETVRLEKNSDVLLYVNFLMLFIHVVMIGCISKRFALYHHYLKILVIFIEKRQMKKLKHFFKMVLLD